jgi:hypothetical protein
VLLGVQVRDGQEQPLGFYRRISKVCRRGHKIREFQRRIDALIDEHQELRRSPPPVSPEHAALRERIVEEDRKIEWDYSVCDWRGLPFCTPESAHHAFRALELMQEEQGLLAAKGVNWRPYNNYQPR